MALKPIDQKRLAVLLAGLMAIILAAAVVFFVSASLLKASNTTPSTQTTTTPPSTSQAAIPVPTTEDTEDYVFTGEAPGEHVTGIGGLLTEDDLEVRAHNLRMQYSEDSAAVCVDVRISNYRDTSVPYTNTDWRIQKPNGMAMPMSYQQSRSILNTGTIPPGHGVSGLVCRMGDLSDEGEYIVTYSPDIAMTLDSDDSDRITVDPADMTFFGWTSQGS